jgi:protease-4
LSKAISFGFDYETWAQNPSLSIYDFGTIIRPFDLLSLGLTYRVSNSTSVGIGIGIRPLSFIEGLGPMLTLTADAHLDSGWGFSLENISAHLMINDAISLCTWYDFITNSFGVEVSFIFGPVEVHGALPSLYDQNDWRVGVAARIVKSDITQKGLPLLAGRKVLFISGIDRIQQTPREPFAIGGLALTEKIPDLPSIIDMLDRAADDSSIVAVVLENLPLVGYWASCQDFAQVLGKLRKSGKKVYIYSDDFENSCQFEALASEADWISLNVNGYLNLTGIFAGNLYFKDLLDKLGIKFVNVTPWATKSANNPFTYSEMPKGERDMLRRFYSDLQDQGLEELSRGRSGKLKDDPRNLIDAGPYLIADKALAAGLIDAVEYRDEFENRITNEFAGARFIRDYPETGGDAWGPSIISKKVAIVYLNGEIENGYGNAGESVGKLIAWKIKQLREDPGISAILLRVNSPGGVINTSDEISREVKMAVAGGKPVIVSMGDLAASGGYYVSAYASRIFAEPGTLTGSIGVTMGFFNFSGTLAKLGIHPDGVSLSESSGFMDPTREFKERDINMLRESLLSYYERFVSIVSEGRRLPRERVREIGEGLIWTGREAMANGLIDELGSLQDAKEYLKEELGGWVEFKNYVIGRADPFGDIVGGLAIMGVTSTTGIDAEKLIENFGPYAGAVNELLLVGTGPLVYYNWMELGN